MKKSNHVMLTAAFLAAIASYSAKAQEIKPGSVHEEATSYESLSRDSTARGHGAHSHGHGSHASGGRGFWHRIWPWGHRTVPQQPTPVAHNGFGNTMRPMSASSSTTAGS